MSLLEYFDKPGILAGIGPEAGTVPLPDKFSLVGLAPYPRELMDLGISDYELTGEITPRKNYLEKNIVRPIYVRRDLS